MRGTQGQRREEGARLGVQARLRATDCPTPAPPLSLLLQAAGPAMPASLLAVSLESTPTSLGLGFLFWKVQSGVYCSPDCGCGQKASGVVKGKGCGDFLMVRGFSIPLAVQGARVRSLARGTKTPRATEQLGLRATRKTLCAATKTRHSQVSK